MNIATRAGDGRCHQILHIKYRRIWNVTAPVTFRFSGQKGSFFFSGSRYSLVAVTFARLKKRLCSKSGFRQSGRAAQEIELPT